MKKKSFILHLSDCEDGNELLVIAGNLDYAVSSEEDGTEVSLLSRSFYVTESLSEVAKLYEETED